MDCRITPNENPTLYTSCIQRCGLFLADYTGIHMANLKITSLLVPVFMYIAVENVKITIITIIKIS